MTNLVAEGECRAGKRTKQENKVSNGNGSYLRASDDEFAGQLRESGERESLDESIVKFDEFRVAPEDERRFGLVMLQRSVH